MRFRFQTIMQPLMVAVVLLLMPACGRKTESSAVVAKVGEDAIRPEAVSEAFRGERLFASPEEELAEKQKFVDRLVELRLLIREAYRQKLDQDSLIRAYEAAERPLFLLDLLYFREVREKIKLSDSELRGLYGALKSERCLRQIATTGKRDADEILARLKKGEDFEKLAQQHSRDRASALKGGDIGCYGWSRPAAGNTEQFLKLKKGDLLGPLEFSFGWAVFKCYDLQPAPVPDFEVIHAELRNLVETDREAVRSAEFVEEIRNQINFRVVDSAARLVNRKQVELSKIETPGQPLRYSNQIRIHGLTPAERDLPLITYRQKTITVGQYLQSIQGTVPAFRMVLDTTEKERALLFQLIFQDALVEVARGRGLDKEPEYLRMVREGVEKQMAAILQNRILAGLPPDSVATRKYFESRPDEFVRPPAVYLYEVNRPLEKELLALRPQILNKDEFLAAAAQLTARTQLRAAYGNLGWVEQFQEPELFAAAEKIKVGQIGGPVKLADGSFSLFYLDDRRGTYRQKFAEVKDSLIHLLWAQARDSALAAWVARQKLNTPITVYPEVLKKTIDYKRYARMKELEAQKPRGRS